MLILPSAAVSKAFSCLSDGDKRAAYDRYGDQEGTGLSGRRQGAGPAGPGFGGDGFDAEEIFNMFFNGGFGGGTRFVSVTASHCAARMLGELEFDCEDAGLWG